MSRFTRALVLAGAVLASACNNSTTNLPTAPTQPNYIPDPYSGTLTRNGANTHAFSLSSAGLVTATLQTLSDPTLTIGLSLGTWNGTACASIIANDSAVEGSTITGQATAFGTLCVRVYDARGEIPVSVDYMVQVFRPE